MDDRVELKAQHTTDTMHQWERPTGGKGAATKTERRYGWWPAVVVGGEEKIESNFKNQKWKFYRDSDWKCE